MRSFSHFCHIFRPRHVQTWIWSKSSHKSLKLFFSFTHETFFFFLFLLSFRIQAVFHFSLIFVYTCPSSKAFHPAVFFFLSLCMTLHAFLVSSFETTVCFLPSPPTSVSIRYIQTRGSTRRLEHLPVMPRPAAHLPAWQHLRQRLHLQAGISASRHDLPE